MKKPETAEADSCPPDFVQSHNWTPDKRDIQTFACLQFINKWTKMIVWVYQNLKSLPRGSERSDNTRRSCSKAWPKKNTFTYVHNIDVLYKSRITNCY